MTQVLPLNQLFRCERCQIDSHADCMGEPCQCICPPPPRPRTRLVRLPGGSLLDLDKTDVRFFPTGWIEAMTTPVPPDETSPGLRDAAGSADTIGHLR